MTFPNPFSADFWVMAEPPDNVVHLNTPYARAHARANASQAAQLLEADREAVRDDIRIGLMRERRELVERIEAIDCALMELHGG